jgi:hypothetical protein
MDTNNITSMKPAFTVIFKSDFILMNRQEQPSKKNYYMEKWDFGRIGATLGHRDNWPCFCSTKRFSR